MARNKRQRRADSSPVKCTCDMQWDTNPPRHADHDGHCALWRLEDFMNGIVDWDPIGQRLCTLYPDTFEAGDAWDDAGWSGDVPIPSTDLQSIVDATVAGYKPDVRAWGKGYVACRHNMTEVRLPDEAGTLVHCSASTDVRGRANRPDWAVYLCNSWYPSSLALFVPWADYGTPTIPWALAREAIEDFYRRAKAGQRVEVGCMGGHGRTGTFLACVAMLADPNISPEGAKAWVRKHYCHKAVEDSSQEYFLRWFADPSLPAVAPPRPKVTIVKAAPAVAIPGGCDWRKNGKPCLKTQGHDAGHYYGGKNVTAKPSGATAKPAAGTPYGPAPVPAPGRKVLCPTCNGKGGTECGACRNWRVVEACGKGLAGPCMLTGGHHGACLVAKAPVSA